MIGCKSANSLPNPSIPFLGWGGILSILFLHKARGPRSFIEWEITNFSEGNGEGWGVGGSNLHQIPQIFSECKQIYLL